MDNEKQELEEAIKKIEEISIWDILKDFTEALKQTLPKRNEIDYMCTKCQDCLFFEEVNMGMDGRIYLCKANKPKDSYFKGHKMRWVSANDCYSDSEIKKFHFRKCKNYCSHEETIKEKLKNLNKNNNQ